MNMPGETKTTRRPNRRSQRGRVYPTMETRRDRRLSGFRTKASTGAQRKSAAAFVAQGHTQWEKRSRRTRGGVVEGGRGGVARAPAATNPRSDGNSENAKEEKGRGLKSGVPGPRKPSSSVANGYRTSFVSYIITLHVCSLMTLTKVVIEDDDLFTSLWTPHQNTSSTRMGKQSHTERRVEGSPGVCRAFPFPGVPPPRRTRETPPASQVTAGGTRGCDGQRAEDGGRGRPRPPKHHALLERRQALVALGRKPRRRQARRRVGAS